jgi:hypothetical protein
MDQQTVLTIFVGITALASATQAVMLISILVMSKRTQDKVKALLPEVKSVMAISKQTLEETQKHISDVGSRTTQILEITKGQFIKIDELLTDATTRAKVQLDRAEMVLDDTMSRTQKTVAILQQGVLVPIREVHGILSGVRAAVSYLGRSRRPTVDHATADEEMFI